MFVSMFVNIIVFFKSPSYSLSSWLLRAPLLVHKDKLSVKVARQHLRSNQLIYVRINPLTFESCHIRANKSIYVRINPFTVESIHVRSNQPMYVRINPFTLESVHFRSNQRFVGSWGQPSDQRKH